MKNNWLAKISTTAARKAGKAELILKKNSPEILLGVGIVGFVGTVITACRATVRADEILDYHKSKIKISMMQKNWQIKIRKMKTIPMTMNCIGWILAFVT